MLLSVGMGCFSPLCKMFYIFQMNLVMFFLLQKDADRAVFVALTSRSVFDLDDGDDVCRVGVAHPLLQVNHFITNWAIYSKLIKVVLTSICDLYMRYSQTEMAAQNRSCFMQNIWCKLFNSNHGTTDKHSATLCCWNSLYLVEFIWCMAAETWRNASMCGKSN